MIDVQNLVKWYGPTLAIDHVSFEIDAGQVVGFLGPNGAGKSTTLRILTGFIPATSGMAKIAGYDVLTQSLAVRAKIGYLPEQNPLYPEMRVDEYLHYRGRLYQMDRALRVKRIAEVCDSCGLSGMQRRLIGHLSKGNRQRVGLAQSLLHAPPLLILDEPTAGLDPTQVTHFRQLIRDLSGQHTVLLSTHILSEVEKTADHVLVIAGGSIVAQGTPQELRRRVSSNMAQLLIEIKAPADEATQVLDKIEAVANVTATMNDGWCQAVVEPRDGQDVRESVGMAIAARQWPVREMRQDTASLEQFFLEITAKQHAGQSTTSAHPNKPASPKTQLAEVDTVATGSIEHD